MVGEGVMTVSTPSFDRVYYDADCGFCVSAARRFERVLARRRLVLVLAPHDCSESPTINC